MTLASLDVAHEAHVRRWSYGSLDERVSLDRCELISDPEERTGTRVGAGGPARVALLSAGDPALVAAARRGLLAGAADTVATLGTRDLSSFAERAGALRSAAPDLVVVLAGDARHADSVVDLCEALRAGCADQSPAPRAVVAGDPRTTVRLHETLAPFGLEVLPDPRRPDGQAALVGRLREFRRGTHHSLILRDEALDSLAIALARVSGADSLVADVAGATTSLVHATPAGAVLAVHSSGIGVGRGADTVVARAGLDRVRRWIPRAVDAPGLLERVFNRARWPDALAAEPLTLLLEIALAHEALGHALADADAAGLPVARMRAAAIVALTGRASDLPRPSQSLLVALDALRPSGLCSVLRDADDALVALGALAKVSAPAGLDAEIGRRHRPLALVAPVPGGDALRVTSEGVRQEERLEDGALRTLPYRGSVELNAARTKLSGRGEVGPLGLVADARATPLEIPVRDAERVPVVLGWYDALDALPQESP